MTASTLEQMLHAVPLLGECDSLEAVPVLASYDRQSYGWLSTGIFWLTTVALSALFMTGIGMILFYSAGFFASLLTPRMEDLLGNISGPLINLLFYTGGALIGLLIFNKGPWRWLVSTTERLIRRVRLRVLLLDAIRAQKERNRRLIDGSWRHTVCRVCLARFKADRVRFAYCRWITFGRCRKCLNDHEGYTGVERITGWLDHDMTASQEQVGTAVRVNMLFRLPPRSEELPLDLDDLVIANVEDEDVEMLIFFYRARQPQTELPKPKRLRCRLTGHSTVSQLSLRQLRRWFALQT